MKKDIERTYRGTTRTSGSSNSNGARLTLEANNWLV